MNKRDKKFVTQEIFDALSSSSKSVKTTQVAFDLSPASRRKLRIEAALDDITPSQKVRETLGLRINAKKTRAKLMLNFTEEDLKFLAEKYNVDPEDKIAIRDKAAEEITREYSEKHVKS